MPTTRIEMLAQENTTLLALERTNIVEVPSSTVVVEVQLRQGPQGPPGSSATPGQDVMPIKEAVSVASAFTEIATSPVDWMIIGGGNSEGQGQTASTNRWWSFARDAIRDIYPVATGGPGYIPAYYDNTTLPAPFTLAGTPAKSTITGLGQKSLILNSAAKKATITLPAATSFAIYYMEGPGLGVGYYKIDGAAAVTFTSAAGTQQTSTGVKTVTLDGNAGHVIEVGWSSGSSFYFEGMVVFNGDETKGFRAWDNSKLDMTTSALVTYIAASTRFRDRLAQISPELVTIKLGVNDFATGITPATMKSNLVSIISTIRTTLPGVPVMLVGQYSVNPSGYTVVAPWTSYVTAIKEIADADASTFMWDLSAWFPLGTADTYSFYADGKNLSDRGAKTLGIAMANYMSSIMRSSTPRSNYVAPDLSNYATRAEALGYAAGLGG